MNLRFQADQWPPKILCFPLLPQVHFQRLTVWQHVQHPGAEPSQDRSAPNHHPQQHSGCRGHPRVARKHHLCCWPKLKWLVRTGENPWWPNNLLLWTGTPPESGNISAWSPHLRHDLFSLLPSHTDTQAPWWTSTSAHHCPEPSCCNLTSGDFVPIKQLEFLKNKRPNFCQYFKSHL